VLNVIRVVAAVLALAGAGLARAAVVIDFQDLTLADYGIIPTTYGSNLDPNLGGVRYRSFSPGNPSSATAYLLLWNTGYGDLTKVAFPSSNGLIGEISLIPAAGYGVRLLSFDMAGWPNADRTNSVMRIVDGDGKVVHDFAAPGPATIQGDANGPPRSTFAPNLFLPGTLAFQWGTDWNIGLDNVRFELVPVASIPEPATWLLLGAGFAVIVAGVRRQRRAR
jgi:hypothetical protein